MEKAVEAAAKAMYDARKSPGDEAWEELAAPYRHAMMELVLPAINAAKDLIIADFCESEAERFSTSHGSHALALELYLRGEVIKRNG